MARIIGRLSNGEFVRDNVRPPVGKITDGYMAGTREQDAYDKAWELVQPANPDGTVNEDFVQLYPEESHVADDDHADDPSFSADDAVVE